MKTTIRKYDDDGKYLVEAGESNVPYAILEDEFFRQCSGPIPAADDILYRLRRLRPGECVALYFCLDDCNNSANDFLPTHHKRAMSTLRKYLDEHADEVLRFVENPPWMLKKQAD